MPKFKVCGREVAWIVPGSRLDRRGIEPERAQSGRRVVIFPSRGGVREGRGPEQGGPIAALQNQ